MTKGEGKNHTTLTEQTYQLRINHPGGDAQHQEHD
jgi:hypothetical protein